MSVRDRNSRQAPRVFLAVFGKHPGWDDHIEDLGVETDLLANIKRVLYVQGIGGNIDAGAWEGDDPSRHVDGFGHLLLWWAEGSLVVGRMWSSRDGKGRARYPMVVCAQCCRLSIPWVLENVAPHLEVIERQCRQTESAQDVRSIAAGHLAELRRQALSADDADELAIPGGTLAQLADHPAMGEGGEGLLRILYTLQREVATLDARSEAPGQTTGRGNVIRLPACGATALDSGAQWLQLLLSQVDTAAPVLVVIPLAHDWVDLVIGWPTTAEFYCVRASRSAIPLASEIPYRLDEEFVQAARRRIEESRAGLDQRSLAPHRPAASRGIAPALGTVRQAAGGIISRFAVTRRQLVIILLICAAVVILAVVLAAVLSRPGPPPPPPVEPQVDKEQAERWRHLCGAYYKWVGRFVRDVNGERAKRWSADPDLRKNIVDRIKGVEFDPRRIARAPGWSLRALARQPPEGARTRAATDSTARAAAAVAAIEEAVTPAKWSLLGEVVKLAEGCKQRGWLGQRDHLLALAAEVKPGPGLAKAIDAVVSGGEDMRRITALWADMEACREVIQAAGDEVRSGFGTYVLARTREAADTKGERSLDRLRDVLADIQPLAEELRGFVAGDLTTRIDRDVLAASPPVPVPPAGQWTDHVFRTWLASLRGGDYDRLDPQQDPRKDWETAQAVESVAGKIDELKQRGKAKEAAELHTEIVQVHEGIKEVLASRWNRLNRDRIGDGKQRLADRLQALDTRVADLLAAVGRTIQAIIRDQPEAPFDSPSLNAEWSKRLTLLAKTARSAETVRPQVRRLRSDLEQLNRELEGKVDTADGKGEWCRAAAEQSKQEREAAFAAALPAIGWADGQLQRPPQFEAKWAAAREAHKQWCDQASRLVSDISTVDGLLRVGYFPGEAAAPAATIRSLVDRWRGGEILRAPGVAKAVSPVLGRAIGLAQVDGLDDRKALADIARQATQHNFGRARAAWHRLGELSPPWPGNPAELEDEREIRKRLEAAFNLVDQEDRRAELRAELRVRGVDRWCRYFAGLTAPEDVANAVSRMGDFAVTPDDLDARGEFNVRLCRFHQAVVSLARKEQVASAIDAFRRDVAKMRIASDKRVTDMLTQLGHIKSAKTEGDAAKAGPMASALRDRCAAALSEDGDSVTCTLRLKDGGTRSLTFLRVQPKGARPAFLCTTEVSLGLLIDVVEETSRWKQIGQLLKGDASAWEGPRVWRYDADGRLEPGEHLLDVSKVAGGEEVGRRLKDLDLGQPAEDQPMQRIGPAAAVWFARLAGCRLPSPAEWSVGYEIVRRGPGRPPPNLRDKSFLLQKRRVSRFVNVHVLAGDFWPDRWTFCPAEVRDAVKTGQQAEAVTEADDGSLWFVPVDPGTGGGPYHLVGNVAEYVYEKPEDLETLQASPDAVSGLLHSGARNLAVIGGSALSPPQVKVDTPYAIALPGAEEGFADVGLRLAFTAPTESLKGRLQRFLGGWGYLPR